MYSYDRSPMVAKLARSAKQKKLSIIVSFDDTGDEIKLQGNVLKELIWVIRAHRAGVVFPAFLDKLKMLAINLSLSETVVGEKKVANEK